MATINYYLDKTDKKGFAPIHMRINCNGTQIKISTRKKIKPNEFDKSLQIVSKTNPDSIEFNHYLSFLKERTDELLNHSYKKTYTEKEIKKILNDHVIITRKIMR